MKKNFKRMLACMLALAMAFALCACGGAKDDAAASKADEATPEYVYNTDFNTILTESGNNYNVKLFSGNGFYATCYEKVGEREIPEGVTPQYEGEYDIYQDVLYFVDFSGAVSKLDAYAPAARESENVDKQDYSSGANLTGLAQTSDGRLVAMESVYESWYDGPEGLTNRDDGYWDNYHYANYYYLRTLDTDGKELSSVALETAENLYFYYFVLDDEDNVVIATENGVRYYALDGTVTAEVVAPDDMGDFYIESVLCLKDGTVAASAYTKGGMILAPVDKASGTFGEEYKLPETAYRIIIGGGDYDAYYTSGVNFYGVNLETGESTKIFSWINCDINSDSLDKILVRDDGSVVCVLNEYDSSGETFDVTVATTSLVPYDSIPHKETITLGAQALDWDVRDKIIAYNRTNPNYRIECIDYSQYNTDEDYTAGLTKFRTELLAGTTPDIICMSALPYTQLASKGILEDLYPYMDADSEFSREDFFPNVLQAMEVNGGLYATASSFYLGTVIGAASVVGDTPGWTYEEFDAALASMPEGCEAFDYYTTRDNILETCLRLDMNNYVNWTTGECNFNSEAFTKLLAFAARFPESFDWETYEYTPEDSTETRISQGRQMLMQGTIYSISDIFYNDFYFGGDATYIGFPTADGHCGNLVVPSTGYAMSAKSTHKDAVWDFLRTFFTEEYQSESYSIPTNINAYNKLVKDAMTPEYEKDAAGNYILDEDGNKIEVSRAGFGTATGEVIEFYALTQEQADELYAAITSTSALGDYSENSIIDIAIEQAQAYFSGQKSAEDVAKLVQSKANIYVNEQR